MTQQSMALGAAQLCADPHHHSGQHEAQLCTPEPPAQPGQTPNTAVLPPPPHETAASQLPAKRRRAQVPSAPPAEAAARAPCPAAQSPREPDQGSGPGSGTLAPDGTTAPRAPRAAAQPSPVGAPRGAGAPSTQLALQQQMKRIRLMTVNIRGLGNATAQADLADMIATAGNPDIVVLTATKRHKTPALRPDIHKQYTAIHSMTATGNAGVTILLNHHFKTIDAVTLPDIPHFFFNLRILHEGHTPAAEAASTEGQQQDTAKPL